MNAYEGISDAHAGDCCNCSIFGSTFVLNETEASLLDGVVDTKLIRSLYAAWCMHIHTNKQLSN